MDVNFTIKVRLLTVCFAPRPERYKEIVLSYRIATLDNVLLDEEIVVKYFIPRNVGCGTILAELVLTKLLNKPVRTYVCKYPCGVDIIQPAENLGCRSFFDSSKIGLIQSLLKWDTVQNTAGNVSKIFAGMCFDHLECLLTGGSLTPIYHCSNFSFLCCAAFFGNLCNKSGLLFVHVHMGFISFLLLYISNTKYFRKGNGFAQTKILVWVIQKISHNSIIPNLHKTVNLQENWAICDFNESCNTLIKDVFL